MLADTILILFISMATALLSEGKYLVLIKREIGLLMYSVFSLKVKMLDEACPYRAMIPKHVKCSHELLIYR